MTDWKKTPQDSFPKLTFMSMEITAEEAQSLILEGWFIAATVVGVAAQNSNWVIARERAEGLLKRVADMRLDPARPIVKCSTCGQTRQDTITSPQGQPGYVVAPEVSALVGEHGAKSDG